MGRRGMMLGGLAAVLVALVFSGGAAARASELPTLNVALTGARSISVSGSMVSGAVSVTSTFSGTLPRGSMGADFGLIQLRPGVTLAEAERAGQGSNDLNALTPYASIIVNAGAPGTVETVLTPGTWVALNLTSEQGQPGLMPFTVRKSSSPAALPAPTATQTAIEFGFRGPTTLRNGTLIRTQNHGYLVHMVVLAGARNLTLADARELKALLFAGKDRQVGKIATKFFSLLGPASPGGMQQEVLNTKPGYYVETCFMDTQDHREHTQVGMLRIVHVV
jgi:hypothetical protein